MGSSKVIDVGSVLFAGRPMSLDERVEVPPFTTVTFPQPARVRLELRRVDRGLDIRGTIETAAAGPCDRCLEDMVVPMTVEVEERFDPPSGTSDPFGENNVLNGTSLDVSDLARQLVTSALPMVLTCPGGCARPPAELTSFDKLRMTEKLRKTEESDHGEPEVENPSVQDA